jgi:hypothetical protein
MLPKLLPFGIDIETNSFLPKADSAAIPGRRAAAITITAPSFYYTK